MRFFALLGALLSLAASGAGAAAAHRANLEDLFALRDLGAGQSGLTLSPDGQRLAVFERTTRLERNDYHYELLVLDARAGATPRVTGDGGGFIFEARDGRRSGASAARTPLWSPDGRAIAYLAEHDTRIELWVSATVGGQARRLAGAEADIRRFVWRDAATIVFETATARARLAARQQQALDEGFLADDRFEPGYSLLAKPDDDAEAGYFTVNVATGAIAAASEADQRVLAAPGAVGAVFLEPLDPSLHAADPPRRLAILSAGERRTCALAECRGRLRAAWPGSNGEAIFQRAEGVAFAETAFYAWRPGADGGVVRPIWRGSERMSSCVSNGEQIFCLQDFATQPRRIVSIDVVQGTLHTVYDPNPQWRDIVMPRIERLDVPAGRYEASFAHLIYPNDYIPGRRYPLLVVQYRSRGLLRWGTGGELPIFAAAAREYFVLSIDRTEARALEDTLSFDEIARRTELDGSELDMKLEQLDWLLRQLDARGLIDRERVGLTGVSDGAETVYGALARGRYGAAMVGSQPTDPLNWHLTSERFRRELSHDVGLTSPFESDDHGWPAWWRDNSAIAHVECFETPLIFALSQSEALYAMPLVVRLRELGLPSETYIYPGAYHLKWRPRQILAMQERTLAWFDFWLRDQTPESSDDPARAARWRDMRAAWTPVGSTPECRRPINR